MFANRKEAGKQLAQKLEAYRENPPAAPPAGQAVVLALPRGGVVTGYEIARALNLPLDIIAVRKIGHPMHPEYAIGAIDESGTRLLNETEAATIDPVWLGEETERQKAEARRRSRVYRDGRTPPVLQGRVVILVDDGIATALTMRLAVRSVKAQRPKKIIVAVPVAPPESLDALKGEGADEVLVLEPPEEFMGAVGAHYVRFEQTEDDEVIRLLKQAYDKEDKK